MSTLTDGAKKRLMTDYYGDGNKSLLLQDIEESAVKRVCFEGYRRNEQQDSVIDLIFTVELAGFGAVKLTQRIGYFENGLEGYNDSLSRMDCTDRILLTDMEPFFNFEPCFDFFNQVGRKIFNFGNYTACKSFFKVVFSPCFCAVKELFARSFKCFNFSVSGCCFNSDIIGCSF